MRQMRKSSHTVHVKEWFITRNFWEYYVLEIDDYNIAFCLVDGLETELGDVDLEEAGPFITMRTKELDGLAPAKGWTWVKKKQKKGAK